MKSRTQPALRVVPTTTTFQITLPLREFLADVQHAFVVLCRLGCVQTSGGHLYRRPTESGARALSRCARSDLDSALLAVRGSSWKRRLPRAEAAYPCGPPCSVQVDYQIATRRASRRLDLLQGSNTPMSPHRK